MPPGFTEGYYMSDQIGGIVSDNLIGTITYEEEALFGQYWDCYPEFGGYFGVGRNVGEAPVGNVDFSSGPITTTFTWYSVYGNPPPDQVLICEHCIAKAQGVVEGGMSAPVCDDGLGDKVTGSWGPIDPSVTDNPTYFSYEDCRGIRYMPHAGGGTIAITASPSAAMSDTGMSRSSVEYGVSVILPIEGHSTVDTVHWPSWKPRFFSHTNCVASATAYAFDYVKQAQLLINGTVVAEYDDTSIGSDGRTPGAKSGTNQSVVPLSVNFDSTHFPDDTPITLELNVTDDKGRSYQVQEQGPAYNEGLLLANHTQLFDPNAILLPLSGDLPNYTVFDSDVENVKSILEKLPAYTLFYIQTHANNGSFGDCFDDGQGTPIYYTLNPDTSVQTSVQGKTVDQPPYNFVFIDGCNSAQNQDPGTTYTSDGPAAFGMGSSQTDFSYTDRAFLGWQTYNWDVSNDEWLKTFWGGLSNGDTVFDAMALAISVNGPTIGGDNENFGPFLGQHSVLSILGDERTKLHGVYLGTDANQWYR